MKLIRNSRQRGYALLTVLVLLSVSLVVLAGTLSRTYTVAKLNDRSNQYNATFHVAEAAVERTFARMAYDFTASGGGFGLVQNNLNLYRTVPNENPFWNDFVFSDGAGNDNKISVFKLPVSYTGNLPSQFQNGGYPFSTFESPIYRIVANARMKNGRSLITNAVQQDVLLARVPISTAAIFSSRLMEFTWCAPFTVNGRVHANGSIYTGTSSSSYLKFNGDVTSVGTISSPAWGGHATKDFKGPVTFNAGKTTNLPPMLLSLNMTNTHALIDMPPAGESIDSEDAEQRLYNQAQIVILVSNNTVTAKIQNGKLPGADESPRILSTNNTVAAVKTMFPFLNILTSSDNFYDQREDKKVLATQIDIGKYNYWLTNNSHVLSKFPANSGSYPTILYVADNRTTTSSQMTAVRITNGIAPPSNGGLGFSVATPNPLYVLGHYNSPVTGYLGTTNTPAAKSVPSAFMCDAITILSSNWKDSLSSDTFTKRVAKDTTVNAAILAGLVYSTGKNSGQFSGGMMNMTRLLEDWGNGDKKLTINTSLISLFESTRATAQFQDPGNYYYAPTRNFSFDVNFYDPAKQPPGMPCALIPVRFNFAMPRPNTISTNVIL